MHVLITGGGCEEAIDGVRSVCNFSTGTTAALIANKLAESGHTVTALMSVRLAVSSLTTAVTPTAASANPVESASPITWLTFRSFDDLAHAIQNEVTRTDYDLVIHAAAVSDYGVSSVTVDGIQYPGGTLPKINSKESITVTLTPHPKIIDHIKSWSRNPECTVVAFKLTNGANKSERLNAVRELFARTAQSFCNSFNGNVESEATAASDIRHPVDYVIHNDLTEISESTHSFAVYKTAQPTAIRAGTTKQELASFFKEILL
jgi:phosphopantothenoylcysteine synthetase/decarboxylase